MKKMQTQRRGWRVLRCSGWLGVTRCNSEFECDRLWQRGIASVCFASTENVGFGIHRGGGWLDLGLHDPNIIGLRAPHDEHAERRCISPVGHHALHPWGAYLVRAYQLILAFVRRVNLTAICQGKLNAKLFHKTNVCVTPNDPSSPATTEGGSK